MTSSFAFAHRRLAIIDPDPRSNQPFLDEELGLAVTYNGEIYNYGDLKRDLLRRGYQFRTESDTEVLCKAFACRGIDSVKRLRGIFAFAIHDHKTGTALLVRDRLGIKPLYYALADNGVVFAPQPSAILQWPGVRPKLDPVGLSSFLSYRTASRRENTICRHSKAATRHLAEDHGSIKSIRVGGILPASMMVGIAVLSKR
ncbi:hypothetical protein LRP30_31565 [Bradyrhizobium sp. C-145]|uniref:asparagine synthetase B family protein n=1 Tax=Bradyrhizobium sp. C-145 TaxID=574727 RepID=UPI00201B65D6|nr:hypothetical protein [Bradyrhizobium sp. C-145]UQR61430.1 hypothetical protein LRP30_31565 [Bradyrhizobium sp. C-145]